MSWEAIRKAKYCLQGVVPAWGADMRGIQSEHNYADVVGEESLNVGRQSDAMAGLDSDGRPYFFDLHPNEITAMDNMRMVQNDARLAEMYNSEMYPFDAVESFDVDYEYPIGSELQPGENE